MIYAPCFSEREQREVEIFQRYKKACNRAVTLYELQSSEMKVNSKDEWAVAYNRGIEDALQVNLSRAYFDATLNQARELYDLEIEYRRKIYERL